MENLNRQIDTFHAIILYLSGTLESKRQTTYCQSPYRNPSYKTHRRTKCQRFEYVRTSSNAAIDSQGNPSSGNLGARAERVKCRRHAVELAPTVIGDNNTIYAMVDSKLDIVGGANLIV